MREKSPRSGFQHKFNSKNQAKSRFGLIIEQMKKIKE